MLKLREERKRRGWSLAKVCALTGGIDPGALSRYERGVWRDMPPAWRRKLAEAFQMSEEELFAEENADERAEAR
ncbi:MAG: helix-turn-helix transcriptional regulator [Bacillota bacterium]